MQEFNPGEQKIAVVPMTNPTARAFDYVAELYMGAALDLMASVPFHLDAGESKDVRLPVTMPSAAGTYPVNVAVFSEGEFIPPVHEGEDVVIVALIPDIRVVSFVIYPHPPPLFVVGNPIEIEAKVTNYGNAWGSEIIRCQVTGLELMTKTVELGPGQSTVIEFPQFTPTEPGPINVTVDGLSKSIEVYEAYMVGVGIFDETTSQRIGDTVIVDGMEYAFEPYFNYWFIRHLPAGSHTFDFVLPAGYRFIMWEIWDWEAFELLQTTYSRPLSIEITRDTFLDALVFKE